MILKLVGAIYQANDLDTAKGFILPFLKPMADGLLEKFQTIDPKSRLQEMTQSLGMGIPKYIVVESSGPEHSKVFKIEAHIQDKCFGIGEGSSKHIAQLFAATEALKTLENQ